MTVANAIAIADDIADAFDADDVARETVARIARNARRTGGDDN